ncbi:MAG: cupredoxin domain-containing protein [Thaumarchaeota archaeon]|nr:cupredoxin domain-containing protein [Nitrososphaerota archaeon]
MSKPIGALFGVLTLVAILAIAPSAFAQESGTTVNISAGAGSSPNCAQTNNCFAPNVINVTPGTTVNWENGDKVSHTVTSGSPSDNQTGTIFDSSLIASGKSFSFTFNDPGTYNYFCQVHPWMTGQVIVAAATSSTTGNTQTTSSTPSNMNSSGTTMSSTPSSMNMSSGTDTMQTCFNSGGDWNAQTQTCSTTTPTSMNSSGTTMSSTPSSTQSNNTTESSEYGAAQTTTTTTTPASTESASSQPSETSSTLSSMSTTQSTSSADPSQMSGWTAGLAIAAVMSGIGVWTAVRRR